MTFVVEVGLSAGAGVDPTYLRLDDPVAGRLDTQLLAVDDVMTDLSTDQAGRPRLMALSIDRGSTQGAGALVEYAAGTLSLTLRDDGGDLDPTSIPEAIPGARIRLSKIWAGQSYPLFTGTIDSWVPEHRYPTQAVAQVTATDMLGSVAGYDRSESAPVGASEDAGARMHRVLDSIGWPAGQRDIDTGVSVLTATDLSGDALDELRHTARTEVGEVWATASGLIRFRNRHGLYLGRSGPATMLPALGVFPDQTAAAITADLDHLQALGAEAVWLVLAMEWAFPTSTTIDPTVAGLYDQVVNQAAARGMPVIIQAHGNPGWNITAGGHAGTLWHGPDNATERANWVTMLHNAVNRWGASKVTYVEVWNEPDIAEFWEQGPSADQYVRLLRDTYVNVKATWPTIQVVGHNMSRNHLGWLQTCYTTTDSIYTAGTAAANDYYFDVLGVHPYTGAAGSGYNPADNSRADETTTFGALDPNFLGYRRLRAAVIAKEGAAKPVGIGEFGYTTSPGFWFYVPEATRAGYLASAIGLAGDDEFVAYFCPFYHRPTDPAAGFQFHGTDTETGFASATAALAALVAAPNLEVRATFGSGGGTELPFVGALGLSYDRSELVNVVRAARDADGATVFEVGDPVSRNRYRDRAHEQTDLPLATDAEVQGWAQYVLARDAYPKLRFTDLTVDVRVNPDLLYPQVLRREFGDRIAVVRRPPGGITDTREMHIRGIRHEFVAPDQWLTTWALEPATSVDPFFLDDTIMGRLDAGRELIY